MSKRREKKNLKSSLLVLLLIAILLIASTYAWFTANTTVTISSLDVNVQASNGLQISTDAVSWKATLTSTDITAAKGTVDGSVNLIPTQMVPVSTDGTVSSGLLNMYQGTMAPIDGDYKLTATKLEDATQTTGYIVFDIYLKADSNMTLTLANNSAVTAFNGRGGTDKGLQNAARVAFVNEGHYASTEEVSTITSSMKGDSSLIWEPNADKHTEEAITASTIYEGLDPVVDGNGTAIPYYGVKAAIDEDNAIPRTDIYQENDTYLGQVTTTATFDDSTTENFITLEAGITKFRVYMWIEGQDVDCDNSASGTDIAYNIQFDAVIPGAGVGG